ncbi:alpha-E domain-containing protein, partial [Photobacterium sanguinicancri]|uniref:alpha-E domain-containing protein n=2 Tax=Gammaproteobacteria TaxID=1236 RepID=UPI0026E429E5
TMRSAIKGTPVVTFLLGDEQFPRSIAFCLKKIVASSDCLPKGEGVIARTRLICDEVAADLEAEEFNVAFREDLNELQLSLADVHDLI